MDILKIEKSAAIKAHSAGTDKQKTMLENLFGKNIFAKNVRERIQNINDVFELNNTTEKDFSKKWENHSEQEKAHALELLIVSAYNGGGFPDMTDGTYKYSPYFNMGSPAGVGFSYCNYDRWTSRSNVGSRQLFFGPEAKENMLDAVEKFLEEYKNSRTL